MSLNRNQTLIPRMLTQLMSSTRTRTRCFCVAVLVAQLPLHFRFRLPQCPLRHSRFHSRCPTKYHHPNYLHSLLFFSFPNSHFPNPLADLALVRFLSKLP